MERAKKKPKLADLNNYRRQGGRLCGVCGSEHRRFIEQAWAAGHSKPSITRYLAEEFGVKLPALGHHLQNHAAKKA